MYEEISFWVSNCNVVLALNVNPAEVLHCVFMVTNYSPFVGKR